MSYRFEQPHDLAAEIRRVAIERLDDALAQLGGEALQADSAVAVHTARKDLKKVRSLMRLARGSLDRDRARAENDRLRAAAHELAATRERDAMSAALAKLAEASRPDMSPACAAWTDEWDARGASALNSAPDVADAARRASALLREARAAALDWTHAGGSWGLIEPGLRRLYRLGRAGLAEAEGSADDETVHEWRKRVKDLWYALRVLESAWPPVIRSMAEEAHRASELLGDHHDLGEIVSAVEAEGSVPPGVATELTGHARKRQDELIAEALAIGRRLYAERPKRFSQRLGLLWEAWEEDA